MEFDQRCQPRHNFNNFPRCQYLRRALGTCRRGRPLPTVPKWSPPPPNCGRKGNLRRWAFSELCNEQASLVDIATALAHHRMRVPRKPHLCHTSALTVRMTTRGRVRSGKHPANRVGRRMIRQSVHFGSRGAIRESAPTLRDVGHVQKSRRHFRRRVYDATCYLTERSAASNGHSVK
jgi:hypothetical protein